MTDERVRTIVHLSDLHFGREHSSVVPALVDAVGELDPDLVAVSGDLTQRARANQFRRARAFLDALPRPQLVVPGNHDVPLFNLAARAFRPLGGFRRFITPDLAPLVSDDLIWAAGVNTTRPWRWKSGGIDGAALARLATLIEGAGPLPVKILVAHHPFDGPQGDAADTLVQLVAAGIDVLLTGHLHASYTGHTTHRYKSNGRAAVVVEAGTAASTRLRQEPNAFNVLRVSREAVGVEQYQWHGTQFQVAETRQFCRGPRGWTTAP